MQCWHTWAVAVLAISWLGGSAVLVRSDPSRDGSPIRRRVSNLELSAQVSVKQDVTDQLPNGWGARDKRRRAA